MEIEVTQADREAAKSLLGRDDAGPSWWSIDSGNADNDPLVQAFARHRATAFAAGKAAREREIVEWLRANQAAMPCQSDSAVEQIGIIADDIEAGEV